MNHLSSPNLDTLKIQEHHYIPRVVTWMLNILPKALVFEYLVSSLWNCLERAWTLLDVGAQVMDVGLEGF